MFLLPSIWIPLCLSIKLLIVIILNVVKSALVYIHPHLPGFLLSVSSDITVSLVGSIFIFPFKCCCSESLEQILLEIWILVYGFHIYTNVCKYVYICVSSQNAQSLGARRPRPGPAQAGTVLKIRRCSVVPTLKKFTGPRRTIQERGVCMAVWEPHDSFLSPKRREQPWQLLGREGWSWALTQIWGNEEGLMCAQAQGVGGVLRSGARRGTPRRLQGGGGAPRPLHLPPMLRQVPPTPLVWGPPMQPEWWSLDFKLLWQTRIARSLSCGWCLLSTRFFPIHLPPYTFRGNVQTRQPFHSVFSSGSQNYHGILMRNPEILIFLVWGLAWTTVFFFFLSFPDNSNVHQC